MDSNWASENLQTIRTLMERSATYRRALAPIMLSSGSFGLVASMVPCFLPVHSNRSFAMYWLGVGMLAAATAYWLARRQALQDQEPFWSPPTRRVTEALLPPFIAGCVAGVALMISDSWAGGATWITSAAWVVLYGCGLSAAGFFALRGIRLFGLAFVLGGSAMFLAYPMVPVDPAVAAHFAMGAFFGLLHLAYGIYLFFTERRRRA